jgi:phage terminase small subunit
MTVNVPHAKGLTKRQELFVAEYLTDLNATRAYVAAGYARKGADAGAARLLVNVKVAEQIAKKYEKRLEKLEISADRVLQELAKLAFYDPINFFEDDGSLKRLQDLDEHTRMALAGIEVTELDGKDGGLLKKIRLADKGQNLERLGKHLKLFTDKLEHSGRVSLADLVIGSYPKEDEPRES